MNLIDEIGDEFKHSSTTIKLYQAALTGDWEIIETIWREHNGWINTRITKGGETVLHIAAAAKHLHLVKELVNIMNDDSLALVNRVGNTALCFAAVSGVVEIARVMVDKSRMLPNIRGSQGMIPLLMAVLLGHQDMVWYLMSVTDYNLLTVEDGIELLTGAIDTDLFGKFLNPSLLSIVLVKNAFQTNPLFAFPQNSHYPVHLGV